MKIVMTITGAALPEDATATVGRELVDVVRRHVRESTRAHVHVEAWTVTAPRTQQEAPPCPEPTSSPHPDPSPAHNAPTTEEPSASPPPSPGQESAPTPGTTPPTTGELTSGGPTPAEDDSSTPLAEPIDEPSPGSDVADGGVIHLFDAPGTPSSDTAPWDDASGEPDHATVARLVRDGGPGFATGADLRAAALELDDDTGAGHLALHLGVPLGVVRGWLREDTARA